MKQIGKGIVFLVVIFVLFWALKAPTHWLAIVVLLGIIFYVLFANPLGKHHLQKTQSNSKKKKSNRKKK